MFRQASAIFIEDVRFIQYLSLLLVLRSYGNLRNKNSYWKIHTSWSVYFIQSKWHIQLTIFIVLNNSLSRKKGKEKSSFDHV